MCEVWTLISLLNCPKRENIVGCELKISRGAYYLPKRERKFTLCEISLGGGYHLLLSPTDMSFSVKSSKKKNPTWSEFRKTHRRLNPELEMIKREQNERRMAFPVV